MASPKSAGRMIRKDVSRSKKIASLSERAGFLFFMLIPHLNSYGKLNGNPHFVKGEVVPLIPWATIPVIEKCLKEISEKTNLKWFEHDGMMWLHSINWEEHQKIEEKKRGADDLPAWGNQVGEKSPTTPRLGSPEVEVKEEVEVEEEGEGKSPPDGGPPSFTIPDEIRPEVWEAFEKHRKKLRKPMTDEAKRLIVLECRKLGGDPNALLEQSIRRGWLDVFPLKDDAGKRDPPGGGSKGLAALQRLRESEGRA
jgi:hypothetical protein